MDPISSELYEKLFNNAAQGMLASDRSGVIRMANDKANSLFGYEKEGLVGYRIADLVPEDKRQAHEAHQENYFKDPSPKMTNRGRELEGVRKDGSTFPIETRLNHLYAEDGEMWVVSLLMDITMRLQSQKVIELSIIEAQEKERERIARDLHDGCLQQLSAISLNLKALPDNIDPEVMKNLVDLTDQGIQEARCLTEQLKPPELGEKGLIQTIREMLTRVERQGGPSTRLEAQNGWGDRSPQYEIALYRICQEGVNNAVKHADSNSITVELKKHEDQGMYFKIMDDGKGCSNIGGSKEKNEERGKGLTGIRQRTKAFDGNLNIWSVEGKGTVIEGFLPFEKELENWD